MAQLKITVMLKPSLLDAQGRVVQTALSSLGFDGIEQVRIGKCLEISLADRPNLDDVARKMCEKLLANPVIENYTYEVIR